MITAKRQENEVWLQQYATLIEDTMMLFCDTPLYQRSVDIFRELTPKIKDHLQTHDIIKISYVAFGLLRTSFFLLDNDGDVIAMSLAVEENRPVMKDISFVDFYLSVAHAQRFFRYKMDNLLPIDFCNIVDAVNCYVSDAMATKAEEQMKRLGLGKNFVQHGTDEKPIEEKSSSVETTTVSKELHKPIFTSKYKT